MAATAAAALAAVSRRAGRAGARRCARAVLGEGAGPEARARREGRGRTGGVAARAAEGGPAGVPAPGDRTREVGGQARTPPLPGSASRSRAGRWGPASAGSPPPRPVRPGPPRENLLLLYFFLLSSPHLPNRRVPAGAAGPLLAQAKVIEPRWGRRESGLRAPGTRGAAPAPGSQIGSPGRAVRGAPTGCSGSSSCTSTGPCLLPLS